jgi:hypothetical protein
MAGLFQAIVQGAGVGGVLVAVGGTAVAVVSETCKVYDLLFVPVRLARLIV